MRIDQLRLLAFGKFTDRVIDLSSGHEGLHIIYGANEAGKSTALHAIEQWLFGIPHRSAHAFLHPMPNLRIGGTIRHSSGRTLSFVRRKGTRDTLRDQAENAALPDDALLPFLGSVGAGLFTSLFGLNRETLVAGGKEILAGKGEVGPLLFAAGSGVGSLRRVREKIRAEGEQLFLPRGKRQINESLREIEEIKGQLRILSTKSQERTDIDQKLDEVRACRQATESRLTSLRTELAQFQLLKRARPAVHEHDWTSNQIHEMGDFVPLSTDFRERYREQLAALHFAREQHHDARSAFDSLVAKQMEECSDDSILSRQAEIEALRHDWGAIEKAARDRVGLEADLHVLIRKCDEQAESLPSGADAWKRADEEELEALVARFTEGREARDRCEQSARQISIRRDRILKAIDALGEGLPIDPWSHLLDEAQSMGDIDRQIERLSKDIDQLRRQLDRAHQSLGASEDENVWKRPRPSIEQAERDAEEVARLANLLEGLATQIEQVDERIASLEADQASLSVGRRIPSLEDLQLARQTRDQAWQALQEEMNASRIPSIQGRLEFEQQIRQADQQSDDLRERAELVARAERNSIDLEKFRKDQMRLVGRRDAIDRKRLDLLEEWKAKAQVLSSMPSTPREAVAWLRLANDAERLAVDYVERTKLLTDLQATKEAFFSRLSALAPAETIPARFADAVAWARKRLEAELTRATNRAQYDRQLDEMEEERARVEADAQRHQQEREQWQKEWGDLCKRLGINPETTPTRSREWIRIRRDLAAGQQDRASIEQRLKAMQEDASRYEEALTKVSDRMGLPTQSIGELVDRLESAREAKTRRKEWETQRALAEAKLEQKSVEYAKAQAHWKTLREEAGVAKEEEIGAVLDRSERYWELQRSLNSVEKQLSHLKREWTGEDLFDRVREVSEHELDERLRKCSVAIEATQRQASEEDQEIGRFEAQQKLIDGQGDGARLAEELQYRLAQTERQAGLYTRYLLAGRVLDETIERYRRENEGSLLRRASEIFSHLTRGSFERLEVDFGDHAEPLLVGIRPGSPTPVSVASMSEGTADQLYLAVRIAAIEQFNEKHEPMPFIVDDILVHFDDDRSKAAFEVLSKLAHKTQVIFFTHHGHLTEVARQASLVRDLWVHDLDEGIDHTLAPLPKSRAASQPAPVRPNAP